jgi:pimeloyl-ACP methyl ester carboxylesterase
MQNTAEGERVGRPSMLLVLTELPRALFELGSLPFASPILASAPDGDGHPVLVLPGFATSDVSTRILRRFLEGKGYDVHAWTLGRNLGLKAIGRDGQKLIDRLEAVYRRTGKKVSIVGWSLGGLMARSLAGQRPDLIRQIITLGSPLGGDPKSTTVWRLYEGMTGDRVDDPDAQKHFDEAQLAPQVPSTAIYSKEDGIVPWQNCLMPEHDLTDNIAVHGSHCGLGVNPSVLYAVANRLAQADGQWKPFDRDRLACGFVYPKAERLH